MLAVLPVAGEYAKNPGHISCMENELGLREFLEERNCEYIVTAGVAMVADVLPLCAPMYAHVHGTKRAIMWCEECCLLQAAPGTQ